MSEDKGAKAKPDDLKPLSVYPLKAEDALSAFMKVDPKKVEQRLTESTKEPDRPNEPKGKPQE